MQIETIRRAMAVNQANLALGHDVFEAEGATFVRDVGAFDIRDANHVSVVRAATPDAIDRLLVRCDVEYAHAPHRDFSCDLDTPPEFEARLALEGFMLDLALVTLLEGELIGSAKPCEIRPLTTDEQWAAFEALHALDWAEGRQKQGLDPAVEAERRMAAVQRVKSPPVRYWLAYADGEPRGYLNAWEGIDGMGQLENLWVHPEWRHRGLATALIHHCVADARAHGAGPIVIVADPTDTPKRMYAAMGFRPIAVKRTWRSDVPRGNAQS